MGDVPELTMSGVSVRAGGHSLLRDVTLQFPRGGWTLLLGASGSGKSTMLRVLNRLREIDAGSAQWRGEDLRKHDVQALRRQVGLVVQEPRLSSGSVEQNLRLPVLLGSVSEARAAERIPRALAAVGLPGALGARDVDTLSGGERRRVALARTLVLQPSTLLLDEPCSGLDPAAARALLLTLQQMQKREGLTLVMVTHRLDEVRGLCDRAAVLDAGELVETGPADRVLEEPRSAAMRSLRGLAGGATRATAD